MYKCPFCKSTNCEEISKYELPIIPQPNQPYTGFQHYSHNDNLVEFVCNDCGIVTKIDPMIYKEENTNESK